MAKETACPVCDAELLFAGDERRGDTVICSYCGAPFTVQKVATDGEDWELDEDF
jgi:predicted amidophosphoribosyltransferase